MDSIQNREYFLKEVKNKNIYIAPITKKGLETFKKKIVIVNSILKEIELISKSISEEMYLEVKEVNNSFQKAIKKNQKINLLKVNEEKFNNVYILFRDSFLSNSVNKALKDTCNIVEKDKQVLLLVDKIFKEISN